MATKAPKADELKKQAAEAKAHILLTPEDSGSSEMAPRFAEMEKELTEAGASEAHFVMSESGVNSVYSPAEWEAIKVAIAQGEIPYRVQNYKGCYFLVRSEEGKINPTEGDRVVLATDMSNPNWERTAKYADL